MLKDNMVSECGALQVGGDLLLSEIRLLGNVWGLGQFSERSGVVSLSRVPRLGEETGVPCKCGTVDLGLDDEELPTPAQRFVGAKLFNCFTATL